MQTKTILTLSMLALCSVSAFAQLESSARSATIGQVYTETNDAAQNGIDVFDRTANGDLKFSANYPTGGLGTGTGLGSQGAVTLSQNKRWLYAVNAGSDSVSVFKIVGNGLQLTDTVATGGDMPISVTEFNNTIYVLNAGSPNTITGFRLDNQGHLSAIAGSMRPLSGASVAPAQVSFSPSGDILVVAEKGSNMLTTFAVDYDDLPSNPRSFASSGQTPFGFAWGKRDRIFVSEAFGGSANASALSSYDTRFDGNLSLLTGSAPTHQTAACWTAVTNDGRYAYTTNAGSSTVSGYQIGRDGTATLIEANGVSGETGANTSPIDVSATPDDMQLIVLNGRSPSLVWFTINKNGTLMNQKMLSLKAAHAGLAVR